MNIGTIRRIDNLGRIVLPKVVRKNLKIKTGDNLEIYIEGENIIIKKHSELNKITNISKTIIKVLKDKLKSEIYITDRDKIIEASKSQTKEKEITKELLNIIEKRQSKTLENINITKENKISGNIIIKPILVNGDILGSLIVNKKEKFKESDIEIINTINTLYEKFLEE